MAQKQPSRFMLAVPVLLMLSAFGVTGRMVPAAPAASDLPVAERDAGLSVTVGGPAVTMTPGRVGYTGPVLPGGNQFNIVAHHGSDGWAVVLPAYTWNHHGLAIKGIAVPAAGRSITGNNFRVTNTGRTVTNPGGGAVLPVLTVRPLPGAPAGSYDFQFTPRGNAGAPFFQAFVVTTRGASAPDRRAGCIPIDGR